MLWRCIVGLADSWCVIVGRRRESTNNDGPGGSAASVPFRRVIAAAGAGLTKRHVRPPQRWLPFGRKGPLGVADGTSKSSDAVRDALCDAATDYVAAGWPIIPTAAPTFRDPVCHRPATTMATARDWWSDRPYGIACPAGRIFDVIEVPATIGRPMLVRLCQPHMPVLRRHDDHHGETWHFLVTPGSPRITDLPRDSPVKLLNRGQAITLPPTPTAGTAGHWVVYAPGPGDGIRALPPTTPEVLSLRGLPHSLQVQWAALRAVIAARATFGPGDEHNENTLATRLRRDYDQGVSINALARQLGRSPKYVRRLLRQAGTTLRQAGYRSGEDPVIWRASQP